MTDVHALHLYYLAHPYAFVRVCPPPSMHYICTTSHIPMLSCVYAPPIHALHLYTTSHIPMLSYV